MPVSTLHDLLLHEMKDTYDAEKQILKALPKMAKAAKNPELKKGFEQHLKQTQEHVKRLEKAFQSLGEKPKAVKCDGMKGLLDEGKKILEDKKMDKAVKDAAMIGAAQKVEHYEICAYGTMRTYAEMMGHTDAVKLFQQTLDEESETDEKLTMVAETVNAEAPQMEEKPMGKSSRKGVGTLARLVVG